VLAERVWNPTWGIVVQGALVGSLTALLAVGLALVYRANRIVNFAQGDLGVAPALLVIFLFAPDAPGGAPDWMTGLPYVPALAVGLVAALLLGFLVERLIINRFARATRLVLTVATIGVAQLLTGLGLFMPGWFGSRFVSIRAPEPPFDLTFMVTDRGRSVVFTESAVLVFVAVPLLLVALTVFLRYTKLGIAVRATAERVDRAAMLGVPVGRVQMTVWMVASVLAFVTIFLRAGVVSVPVGSALGVSVLVPALGAAVIGRMEDFPRIAAAAIGLGIVEQSIVYRNGSNLDWFPWLFGITIVAMLLNRRRRGSRVQDEAVSSWQAARESRPIPTELRPLPEVRVARFGGVALIALFLLSLPVWMSGHDLSIATDTGVIAIIAVSLVILTGWAGHVSLGHMAFAALGAAVAGWLTQTGEYDFTVALLGAGAVGAAGAVVLGIPAARAGGLTLAVATLAFASAVLYWLLNPDVFDWVPRGRFPSDPVLFAGSPLEHTVRSQTSFYYLTLAVLAIAVFVAYGLRRTRTGRVLIASRENPRAAEAYGINANRTMLTAFAFSGFLAAVAGAIFVHHLHFLPNGVTGNPFSAEESIRVFATVVIGGLGSVPGAVLGAVYVFTAKYHLPSEWSFLATGIGLLLVLLVLPGGLGGGLAEARDAMLRALAKRRHILVPSLVADRRAEPVPEVTPAMAAAVAEAVERPEIEQVEEVR
jgi:branched-chain amino acid transport system permease protein